MNDLMLDIETLGNSTNPVLIQIGAVFFDRKTGEIGDEFCVNVDEDSCLYEGFTKDKSTVEWWAEQDQEVLKKIRSNTVEVRQAIKDFRKFCGHKMDLCVWSHATFDFPIIQNYLKKFKEKPLRYKGARDLRTLVDLSGIDLDKYDWTTGKTHNALDDCKFQIKYCIDAIDKLNKKNVRGMK